MVVRLLVVLAILLALIGFFSLSQATTGVGILACACLFAIFARIAQASDHHAQVMKVIGQGNDAKTSQSSSS